MLTIFQKRFNRQNRAESLIFFIFGMVFVYTGLRAYVLSISHDEAVTYLYHASRPFGDILTNAGPFRPNNHLLNTILIKCFVQILGLHEFTLRLPALIGHGFYLLGIYRIIQLLPRRHLCLPAACLLTLNPFLGDLFSLARGYALALGFFANSLYYYLLYVVHPKRKLSSRHIHYSLFLAALAVWSNFSFLTTYAALGLCMMGYERKNLKKIIRPLLISTLGLIPCSFAVIRLISTREYYIGGVRGVWNDTVHSLIEKTLYHKSYGGLDFILITQGFIIFCLLFAILYTVNLIRHKQIKDKGHMFFGVSAYLLSCIFFINLQHHIFHIKYPQGRSAIYLLVLFGILIVLLLGYRQRRDGCRTSQFGKGVMFVLSVFVIIHFGICMNLKYFPEWQYDAQTKQMMSSFAKNKDPLPGGRNSQCIGASWLLAPAINFYKIKNELLWLRWTEQSGADQDCHIYYLLEDDSPFAKRYQTQESQNILKERNLEILSYFELSRTILAKPRDDK